ncbi:MAG: hypothetical protein FWF19_04620 [Euryarchaeota archaeon]|nr:hypothetical protein [Euryarchaeota archaeon]
MGATLEDRIISESYSPSELSPENAQALVVFDTLLNKLDGMAGSDTTAGVPIIRVANVFLDEGANGQNEAPFLTELTNTVINSVPADSAGIDECYGCASVYLIDSVATLFYISSNLMHDDSVSFAENLDYLKYLTIEMESYDIGSYGSVDSGYIDALQTAIDGMEEVRNSPDSNAQAIAVFEILIDKLNVLAGSDANSGNLFTRLTNVFFGESVNGQSKSIFLANLIHAAVKSVTAAPVVVDECYECSSIYLIDSVATLFDIAGSIMNDDQENFVEQLAYLKYLISEMEHYGGVDFGYIDALQAAIGGWEEVYGPQTLTGVYISDARLTDVLQG